MLKFLSGRKRSRNAVLILFIGLLTLSLVALFSAGGSGKFFGGTAGSDTVIAKVGNYEVTVKEFKDRLSDFGTQVAQGQGRNKKDDINTLYDMYGPQVLDSLIREKVILYDAERLNLGSSDNEVQARLKQIFSPWQGFEQYRLRVEQAGMTPVRFEENLRASIAQEHLRSFITAAVAVDPKEIEQDFRGKNTSSSVRWVELDPVKFREKVQTTETDLRAYFDSHKDDFKITSEQRRVRYIFVDSNQAGQSLQVSDDELKADFNPEAFVKRVRVSQIVLNVPKEPAAATGDKAADKKPAASPVTEEDIRTKAQGISQRAQGSEGNPAEDFAKLARDFSEDAATKAKGGDLGWINKGDKRDATDPLNRVFNMRKDETSQPIKKGDSYYVLKVTDRETPTFAAAREDLLKAARLRKGYSKAVEIATDAEQQFTETKNAESVVAAINKKYGAPVASAKETPFFSEGDTLTDLGAAPEFQSAVFELENPGDTGKQMPVDKGFAVPQYIEKRDPHVPTYEEVNTKVDKAYRAEKGKDLAIQRAKELAKAQNLDELKKLTSAAGLKLDERLGLTSSDSIGPLVSETSRAPVYKLKVGEVTKEPIKGDNDVYVVAAIEGRKEADMGEPFQKERKSIEQRLLDDKRNTFFSTYLAMTQKQMKDEGKIKVYDDVIAAAIQGSGSPTPPAQQPSQPRMPSRTGAGARRTAKGAQGTPAGLPKR